MKTNLALILAAVISIAHSTSLAGAESNVPKGFVRGLFGTNTLRLSTDAASAATRYSFRFRTFHTDLENGQPVGAEGTYSELLAGADSDRVFVRIMGPKGEPYCQIEDGFLLTVDRTRPGSLAYHSGGKLVFYFKQDDPTNVFGYGLEYGIPAAGSPNFKSDIDFNLGGALSPIAFRTTSTTYSEAEHLLDVRLNHGELIKIRPVDHPQRFAVELMRFYETNGFGFSFEDFKISDRAAIFKSRADEVLVKQARVLIRQLSLAELASIASAEVILTNFPANAGERKASDELKRLLEK